MKVLVTGTAGFIGSFVAQALLARGDEVVGVDNLNDYYDPELKRARLRRLEAEARFRFEKADLADRRATQRLFEEAAAPRIVHLAAQAGVRHSIADPHAYVDANVVAFLNILEAIRASPPEHFVYASTSAVYGANARLPYAVADSADAPLSMYAATKKSNELMAHVYSHLYGVPTTGLRFFTVYGPWGRPDMALFEFTRRILADEPIDVFNYGNHRRDFTYIDDIVEGVLRVLDRPPDAASTPYRLYNIGNSQPVQLMRFIAVLEDVLGRRATKNLLPMQPGDVPETYADTRPLERDFGYRPSTPVETGIARFVAWYRDYYDVPAQRPPA
ncbi:MAG: NAD-dependent epimerase [Gammaproteobacteria bacterium]|nr:NAD-dependent epimerase [Gammaproteobacteria bacterium]